MNTSTLDIYKLASILEAVVAKARLVELTPCKRLTPAGEQDAVAVHLEVHTTFTVSQRDADALRRLIDGLP